MKCSRGLRTTHTLMFYVVAESGRKFVMRTINCNWSMHINPEIDLTIIFYFTPVIIIDTVKFSCCALGRGGQIWRVPGVQHFPEPRARVRLPEEFRDRREDQQDQVAPPT